MGAQIYSMTGFAALAGQAGSMGWDWDIRSVNARGLDIRLRLADGFEALEAPLRKALGARLARGSVSVTLKAGQQGGAQSMALNGAALQDALGILDEIATEAAARGHALAPHTASDVAQMRGVLEFGTARPDGAAAEAAAAQIDALIDSLLAVRAEEGAALAGVLQGQIDQIAALTKQAHAAAEARAAQAGALLEQRVAALLGAGAAEPERLAQELALLAVKTDITEELDRLGAHIAAARDILSTGGPVGRRLDFLMQEFNREANTLCSKAQSTALTAIGLELKLVIDQMREQVQNLE